MLCYFFLIIHSINHENLVGVIRFFRVILELSGKKNWEKSGRIFGSKNVGSYMHSIHSLQLSK